MRELGAYGLPITILIDREGREIGRLVGPAEWDAPEVVAILRGQVEEKPTPTRPSANRNLTSTRKETYP